MHILRPIQLTGAFDVGVGRQCVFDEIQEPFLAFGMTLYRLHDETMRGPPGFAGERGNPCFELRRKLY